MKYYDPITMEYTVVAYCVTLSELLDANHDIGLSKLNFYGYESQVGL
jgi:hypothetical protein